MYFGLIILFFIAAAIYASVGFGGGSTYTALLAISGTPYYTIPVITLICNICVVTSNCLNYANAKLIDWKRASPIVAASVPMAWFGGQLSVLEVVVNIFSGQEFHKKKSVFFGRNHIVFYGGRRRIFVGHSWNWRRDFFGAYSISAKMGKFDANCRDLQPFYFNKFYSGPVRPAQ